MAWVRWIDALRARIRTLVGPGRADDDLHDELAFQRRNADQGKRRAGHEPPRGATSRANRLPRSARSE